MASEPEPPAVLFVPTPIGNLGDITRRAIEALDSVDTICCEDTRHSGRLLKHLGLTKALLSYHEHNEKERCQEITHRAAAGESFAVISDAGLPGISDPGYRLLVALREAAVDYSVLPGPSAVLTALVASALPSDAFFFGGFLPIKKGKRRGALQTAIRAPHSSIFFESPHRLPGTLAILSEIDPAVPTFIARELTKKFESYEHGTAHSLATTYANKKARGEIVLVLGGTNCPRPTGIEPE